MDISVFANKEQKPNENDLTIALGKTYKIWFDIQNFVIEKYAQAIEDWNFPGKKYGWSFRMKDKKRAIIYFLPRDGFFKVAFVFGLKAMDQILESSVSENIKTDLQNARVYAEGRGIQIEVKDKTNFADIQKLIEIKLAN